jgi:hypothetical protein
VGRVKSGQDQGDTCGTELNKELLQTIGKEQPVKNTRQQMDSKTKVVNMLSKVMGKYFHEGTMQGN